MHIILTHEQADFDALGALLGAHLLNEKAIPVLPRRINRNGRAFITLYGAELPFVEARDLPAHAIETVTLVDTHSLNTMKGMSAATRIHVIDHHPLRDDLPNDWVVQGERLGACTTHFVEIFSQHNGSLNVIPATLLMLGIYEDTGSLTYVGTTPRDVRAAAYLMEHGASLRIATQYLNPPLSPEQLRAYDQLLSVAETHTIHGHTVIIACAELEKMTEEISSVAHKLRDLLDPDALLLLVHTSEGIRLVARSTTDQINVAAIAAEFGGGGHDRAAGALLQLENISTSAQEDTLQAVRERLIEVLPPHVRPPINVKQLMSHKPLVLSPTTSAKDAAELMKRYGYEGYPVVEKDRVIGLLTRRAVDRALAHKLNLTAGSLMEAGEVTVQPSDGLEHLQHLMTSTGWGQVPVVDPKSKQIIGIVTRTDLLKTLAGGENCLPEKQNLASRLEAALPPARIALLQAVASQSHQHRQAAYTVGGFVRDLLLDRPSLDFDIVIEGDAIALGQLLVKQFGGKITSHKRFGTAKWRIDAIRERLCQELPSNQTLQAHELPESIDLISARTEFYNYPTALPTVERSSIKLDLHRRDFTINTMALRLDGHHYGELYDYWGGHADLRRGLVRVLHSLSFVDDPTRMLRAVRFEQRFGLKIENRTLQLMKEAQPMLRQVSGQRLAHELELILSEETPATMLRRLQELGLLSAIHPDLVWKDERAGILQQILSEAPPDDWQLPEAIGRLTLPIALAYLIWLAPLSLKSANAISDRLRLPRSLKEAFLASSRLWQHLPEMPTAPASEIVRRLEKFPLLALYAIHKLSDSQAVREMINRYLRNWCKVKPVTDGSRLQQLGVTPGPHYKQILTTLRDAWLDGKITTSQQEEAMLQQMLESLPEQTAANG